MFNYEKEKSEMCDFKKSQLTFIFYSVAETGFNNFFSPFV